MNIEKTVLQYIRDNSGKTLDQINEAIDKPDGLGIWSIVSALVDKGLVISEGTYDLHQWYYPVEKGVTQN